MADIDEGEVLWIDQRVCDITELPGGFPFLVVNLLGWAEPWRVAWVRGIQLDERTGAPVRERTLAVPIDQPRAVRTGHVTGSTAPVANGDAVIVGPPPGYRRRELVAKDV
jgi:hypothetical protein